MRVENSSFPHSAELSPETFGKQQPPVIEKHYLASGGNRLNLPPEIKDLQYESHRRRVEARSNECRTTLAERIQIVRQRMQEEYGDDLVINDPPHIVPSWENRNQRHDETGLSYFVEDPLGVYLPHGSDAVIRDQRLKDDDSEITGVHWIEGHQFQSDSEGNFLLDAAGGTIPLGEFITGPDGPETVVTFQFYVRKDGYWFYKGKKKNQAVQTEAPVVSESEVKSERVVFDTALIA